MTYRNTVSRNFGRTCGRRLAVAMGMMAVVTISGGSAGAVDASPEELVEALRAGGHVMFIRHAATEKDYADQIDAVMGDCSTQRTLSEAGWQDAKAIAAGIKLNGIPVGKVFSSEYCRSWQTAEIVFGHHVKRSAMNFEPAEEYTEEQIETMRAGMTPLLSMVPGAGHNIALIGHDDPFEAATGIYPEPMGVTFVLKPDGDGGFEVLGSIAPDAWPTAAD